ncbi:hypothetical protein SAMN04515647_4398 [Cohaesibacter sp. ES.047]|nr:hypothetical protein SAMN04515647_4398 [Cohaesibacter sp. ES.047]
MQVYVSLKNAPNVRRFDNMIKALGEKDQKLVYVRAINHSGAKAFTQVKKALAKETGLAQKHVARYVAKPRKANFSDMAYRIRARGGDVPIKYFKAKERKGGVTAKPWGKKKFFPNHFITSGRVGHRFSMIAFRGHVFEAFDTSTRRWGRSIRKGKSGVVVPAAMIDGAAAQAFRDHAAPAVEKRLEHELRRVLL